MSLSNYTGPIGPKTDTAVEYQNRVREKSLGMSPIQTTYLRGVGHQYLVKSFVIYSIVWLSLAPGIAFILYYCVGVRCSYCSTWRENRFFTLGIHI